jgi:hypothetical protein
LVLQVTQTGAQIGTPPYMAPEQHHGAPATARSDQFAFCVALYEALTGARPFEGTGSAEILAAMRRPEAPKMTGVPRFMAAAVARGLRYDPEQRHASLGALLRILERDPARRARRWLVAGGAAAALAVGGYLVAGAGGRVSPCGSGREPLAGLWDDGARAAVRAHARAIDPVLGDERLGRHARRELSRHAHRGDPVRHAPRSARALPRPPARGGARHRPAPRRG